jgi:hypothetical protein
MALENFDIRLEFNAEGKVNTVSYADGDGCGHEALFSDPNTKLRDVVDYHLRHYLVGHKQSPKKRCPMTMTGVDPDTQTPLNFRCILEPHRAGSRHQLEQY